MGSSLTTALKKKINDINPWAKPLDEQIEEADEKPLRIVERKEWTSVKPKWRQRLRTPINLFLLRYFSDSPSCSNDVRCSKVLRKLQEDHMKMGLPDIAYNFMVSEDGTVYEGRGWTTNPSKLDYNYMKYHGKTIDIAILGDYSKLYLEDGHAEAVCRLIRRSEKLGYTPTDWDVLEIREQHKRSVWDREEMEKKFDAEYGEERMYEIDEK